MNIDNTCAIFYDKYAGGSHRYKNPLTVNIQMKDLFTNYVCIDGENAITTFNTKFGENIVIPETFDFAMMNIHIFQYIDGSNIELVITILTIDTHKVGQYYEKHNTIPNHEFVTNACMFHTMYEKQQPNNIKPDDNIDVITRKVIIPNPDIVDLMIDDPKYMKCKLHGYQRRSIRWMIDTEKKSKKVHYDFNHNYQINIGRLIFDPVTKKLFDRIAQNYLEFKGGALIDEVGLGKTIQMINLIVLNRAVNLSLINSNPHMLRSRATLIICPNQLCNQWAREIKKMISDNTVSVVLVLTKIHHDTLTYYDILNADIVIMSYNFISNQCFTDQITQLLDSVPRNYCASKSFKQSDVKKVIDSIAADCVSDQTILFKKNVVFPSIYWHRIIVDEFHEALTVKKYAVINNLIPLFQSEYKWAVTGTPFDHGSTCFWGMFNMITNYQNQIGNEIICLDEINRNMMDNFFRRNTKKSVEDEFKLPDLMEKIIWLRFTQTERMMYNAYLANPNVERSSEIIRQICCHPKIAEEFKGVLDNCKTLDDIQNKMVKHYEKQYKQTEKQVNVCKLYCMKTERRILIVNYKRQRKFLRQEGYRVKIELPVTNFPAIESDYADDNPIPNMPLNVDLAEQPDNLAEDDDEDEDDNEDENEDENEEGAMAKPLMVVCEANQNEIIRLIKHKLDANPSQTIKNMYETLEQQNGRLNAALNIFKGKKGSYDFFNNMLERIRRTTDKAKKKYELEIKNAYTADADNADNADADKPDADKSDTGDDSDDEDDDTCGICLNTITGDDIGVTNCGHIYCYECLKITVKDLHRCPMCNKSLTVNDISMISYEKPVYTKLNSNILRNKLDLINKVGTKLTNLIYYLNQIDDHVIIFSQWDSLLRKVGDVLNEYGIRNVFCRGNVWMRDKAIREFMDGNDIRVIMLSSESAASGTNLTKATKVILLDPVVGEYEYRRNMEWQAIGRAYRMGQTQRVEVVRMIIKDTIEEDIYMMNKTADAQHNTIHKISETTDETILLSDDKLIAISLANDRSKEKPLIKNKTTSQKKANINKIQEHRVRKKVVVRRATVL